MHMTQDKLIRYKCFKTVCWYNSASFCFGLLYNITKYPAFDQPAKFEILHLGIEFFSALEAKADETQCDANLLTYIPNVDITTYTITKSKHF